MGRGGGALLDRAVLVSSSCLGAFLSNGGGGEEEEEEEEEEESLSSALPLRLCAHSPAIRMKRGCLV